MSEAALPGFSDETLQWRARALQLVNWGGFHGHTHVDFSDGGTLISGASGTGKSTLLDAYTALMMPSAVPFNGASNNATTGRARDVTQRNVLTYLKGKRDTGVDGSDQALRGDGAPVWGALAMTFQDDFGRRFTPLRTYWVPVGATHPSDVAMKLFTLGADIDLAELEEFAAGRFDPRAMRSRFPAIEHHDTLTRFFDTVTSRLGIGTAGEGERALRLLARIQAGHQVRTVDRLYKELVLERPKTYDAAARVLAQFASLDQSYRDLETAAEKKQILDPIPELHEEYQEARERVERLDRYGVVAGGERTPFHMWRLRAEARALRQAEDDNRALRADATSALDAARETLARCERDVKAVEEQIRAEGGGAVERLAAEIQETGARLERVTTSRAEFDGQVRALGVQYRDETEFDALRGRARTFLSAAPEQRAALQDRRDALVEARPGLVAEVDRLRDEYESLRGRDGLVPVDYDRARNQIAEACGLSPRDLPFAAELMDLRAEYEAWRLAAEVTLRGVGLTLLLDQRRQAEIRRRIDSLDLERRINFEGVEVGLPVTDDGDDRYLSGRLRFKADSPFAGWVQRRVSRRGFDHRCVDVADLGGDEPAVTIRGQVASGRRGAHGRTRGQRFILGFNTATRVQEIRDELQDVVARQEELASQIRDLDHRTAELGEQVAAHQVVLATTWTSIDVATVEAELVDLKSRHAELVGNSDVLAALQQRLDDLLARQEVARTGYHRAWDALEAARGEHGEIVERSDAVADAIEDLADQVELSDDDEEHLDAALGAASWRSFTDQARDLGRRLRVESATESQRAQRLGEQLQGLFERFNDRWPDPNRGVSPVAYPEYAAILDGIVRHGLFERRKEFRSHFQEWSGHDLKLLGDAFEEALEDIHDRLEPVNEILGRLPFGARSDRLRITVRELRPQSLGVFRRELRELSSDVGADWAEEQLDDRFQRLRAFVGRLVEQDAGRDDLLDVRRHIEVSATKVDEAGTVLSTYSSLGGKSGGETQELVSFIVGAALRYQLGDETRTRPRFAPVLLDEGFIKADGEFAFRAVRAWRGLGFQLIVGAPLDKVTALEPHMDLILAVTKNDETGFSYIQPLQVVETEEEAAEPPQTDG